MDQWNISGKGLNRIAALKNLKVLDLYCPEGVYIHLNPLAALKSLEELRLFGDVDYRVWAIFKNLPLLTKISLSGFNISDRELEVLASYRNWKKLGIFHIAYASYAIKSDNLLKPRPTRITGDGLKHIGGLHLKRLGLPKAMTDDKLVYLRDIENIEELETLELSDEITDEGLKHLFFLDNLKKLYINANITKEGLLSLAERNRNLEFGRLVTMD